MSSVVAPGRAARAHTSCISATTRPALAMMRISSGDFRVPISGVEARFDRREQPILNLVLAAQSVDGDEYRSFLVELDQWPRLGVVELEPAPDGVVGVVLTTPGPHPLDDDVGRNVEIDDHVQRLVAEDGVEFERLLLRAGKSVEYEAGFHLAAVREPLGDDCHHEIVRDEFAAVHEILRLEPGG